MVQELTREDLIDIIEAYRELYWDVVLENKRLRDEHGGNE